MKYYKETIKIANSVIKLYMEDNQREGGGVISLKLIFEDSTSTSK